MTWQILRDFFGRGNGGFPCRSGRQPHHEPPPRPPPRPPPQHQPPINHEAPTTNHRPITDRRPPTTHPTTHHTTHHPPATTNHHPPRTTYHPPPHGVRRVSVLTSTPGCHCHHHHHIPRPPPPNTTTTTHHHSTETPSSTTAITTMVATATHHHNHHHHHHHNHGNPTTATLARSTSVSGFSSGWLPALHGSQHGQPCAPLPYHVVKLSVTSVASKQHSHCCHPCHIAHLPPLPTRRPRPRPPSPTPPCDHQPTNHHRRCPLPPPKLSLSSLGATTHRRLTATAGTTHHPPPTNLLPTTHRPYHSCCHYHQPLSTHQPPSRPCPVALASVGCAALAPSPPTPLASRAARGMSMIVLPAGAPAMASRVATLRYVMAQMAAELETEEAGTWYGGRVGSTKRAAPRPLPPPRQPRPLRHHNHHRTTNQHSSPSNFALRGSLPAPGKGTGAGAGRASTSGQCSHAGGGEVVAT